MPDWSALYSTVRRLQDCLRFAGRRNRASGPGFGRLLTGFPRLHGSGIVRATMRALYTIIYTLGFILLSPLFLYKMWKRGKYRENFLQRFGRYSPALRQRLAGQHERRCWLQAVSVGEINLALSLIPALRQRLPDTRVVLTTTTSTGYALARGRLPAGTDLLYFPQDFPWTVRRAYDLIQPDFIILMESEVWPHHVWAAAHRRRPVFLINARMSPRSARRHRWGGWLFQRVFDKLTLVCAQSREDAAQFQRVGALRVELTGNLKYDAALPAAGAPRLDAPQVLRDLGIGLDRPILVAGSTHPGEEAILFAVCAALRQQYPDLFLVLVPRHVERTPEIVALAQQLATRLVLRTDPARPAPADCQCLLVNTTGELRWFYEVATVIFVGKSLVGEGGQNIVEAAASGHPVVFGPHMQNFKAIAAEFVATGAGVQVPDAAALQRELAGLLATPARRDQIAAAARQVIERNRGATVRTVELIAGALSATSGRSGPVISAGRGRSDSSGRS